MDEGTATIGTYLLRPLLHLLLHLLLWERVSVVQPVLTVLLILLSHSMHPLAVNGVVLSPNHWVIFALEAYSVNVLTM
jgi:hypothetical protein